MTGKATIIAVLAASATTCAVVEHLSAGTDPKTVKVIKSWKANQGESVAVELALAVGEKLMIKEANVTCQLAGSVVVDNTGGTSGLALNRYYNLQHGGTGGSDPANVVTAAANTVSDSTNFGPYGAENNGLRLEAA